MSAPQRLTKKQKKALAFRDRGKGRSKTATNEDALEGDGGDVPIAENQDLAEIEGLEAERLSTPDKPPKGKQRHEGGSTKKRKRDPEDDLEEQGEKETQPKPVKKAKKMDKPVGEGEPELPKKGAVQKYILFVGNLRYTTSKEAISSHFSSCDPQPAIRLSTPKNTNRVNKSNGFAFLEFTEKKGLQTALKLHHSDLEGRKINVELTSGGGGKSEVRMNKIKERNKGLHEQRKRKLQKQKTPAGGDNDQLQELERPQRYSTTSGIGQAPSNKKTWSIPGEGEETRSKNSKNRRTKPKDQGTGVNAIPVY